MGVQNIRIRREAEERGSRSEEELLETVRGDLQSFCSRGRTEQYTHAGLSLLSSQIFFAKIPIQVYIHKRCSV